MTMYESDTQRQEWVGPGGALLEAPGVRPPAGVHKKAPLFSSFTAPHPRFSVQ